MSRFDPLRVLHIDLANGLPEPDDGSDAFAILWSGDVPLGHAELTRAELASPAALAQRLARAVAPATGERLFASGFEQRPPSRWVVPVGPAPPVDELLALSAPLSRLEAPTGSLAGEDPSTAAVIICTRGRPQDLARCLESLRRLAVGPGETIVVDNEPGDAAARQVVSRFGEVSYVAEPRPGLSVARNTGIAAARGRVIAFVDDDTVVHERWLERLLRGFESPKVLAVTGLVLPAELRTRAQVVFEKTMGGAQRGYRRIVFDADYFARQVRYGVPVWAIGAGANMAIRREALDKVGLYDERLGAGAAGCSEDSELWYRILAGGGECRYVPDSVVLHWHRRDMAELRRQSHDYLRGHVAALFVQFAAHRHRGNLRRAALTIPRHLLRRSVSELGLSRAERTGTLGAEVSGYLAGLALWRLALAAGDRQQAAISDPVVDGR